MFCSVCGKAIGENASFCRHCGAVQNARLDQPYAQTERSVIGFCQKINDPAFASYKKKSASWSLIFSFILAVIAVIGFPIYGNASGEIDWPDSLYYGLGIGSMFIVIALLQTLKRGLDKTWDGVIEDKKSYTVREINRKGMNRFHRMYVLKVRKDSGGVKKHKWRDTPGLYDYYSIGDRVRHHKGFYYYEKYDKSGDSEIICASCLTMNDISSHACSRCKCPLLKG